MGTVTSNAAAWPRLRETFHHYGLTTSPDDVYLAHRGLHSIAARLRQHTATALRLIEWLQAQPRSPASFTRRCRPTPVMRCGSAT